MDDQLMQYLFQMGAMNREGEGLQRQQALVDSLRGQMQPQLMRAGNVAVGPSALGGLASVAAQFGTGMMTKSILDQQKQLDAKRQAALEAMRGGMGGGMGGGGGGGPVLPGGVGNPY